MNIQEIRTQYPMYSDLSDQELLDGLHSKFYSDIPKEDFYSKVGYKQSSVTLLPQEQEKKTLDQLATDYSKKSFLGRVGDTMGGVLETPATLAGFGLGTLAGVTNAAGAAIGTTAGGGSLEDIGKEASHALESGMEKTRRYLGTMPETVTGRMIDTGMAEGWNALTSKAGKLAGPELATGLNKDLVYKDLAEKYKKENNTQFIPYKEQQKLLTQADELTKNYQPPKQALAVESVVKGGLDAAGMLAMAKGGITTVAKGADFASRKSQVDSSKLDAAKAESDRLAEQESIKGNSFAAKRAGFTWNPETKRMERGTEYIDPITNTIVDPRAGQKFENVPQGEGLPRTPETQIAGQLTHQAGEPLVTFPDGTTMTRAEFERSKQQELTPEQMVENMRNPQVEPGLVSMTDRTEPVQALGKDVDVSNASNPYFTKGIDPTKINVEEGITPPVVTRLAGTGKDGVIRLNEEAIKADFENGFPYIFEESGSPAGTQKRIVFEKLNITPELFKRWIPDVETYRRFLQLHEESHLKNKDRESYPRTEDGKWDLMNEKAIEIESRATVDALSDILGLKTKGGKQAGVGGKQGGAIDFSTVTEGVKKITEKLKSGDPSFKEFADHLGRDTNDKVAMDLYEKYYGKSVSVHITPEEAAISKIPGLKEVISNEVKPIEEMIPRWELESDATGGGKGLGINLSAGGRMTAMRTGNSFIDWNVESILGRVKEAQATIKNVHQDIKAEVNKVTGSILTKFKDKGAGERTFIEAMSALLRSEGKLELPQGISKEAALLAQKLRTALDDLGLKIQEELRAQGVTNFQWRPNYLAGVFFGPYRSLVKNSAGEVIGVIAGKTKAEATAAIDYVKQQMPDVQFDVPNYNPKFDKAGSDLGARYGKASEVLELLRNQSEASAKLQEHLSDFYKEVQDNYMGYKQHFKQKKGVFGAEGNRPWANAKENAYDLLEAQLGIIDHGYHWLAEQAIAKDMDRILTNEKIQQNMPHAVDYVNTYLDHAFGRLQDKLAVVDSGITWGAQQLGIAPSALKEFLAIIRNAALTNTLGLSGGFALTQFVQVPQTLAVAFAKAKENGIVGSKSGSTMIGTLDLINGLNGKLENMSREGRYFFDYFRKGGELDPHLVEHTIHRKVVSTTGMNPIQKATWEAINGTAKGVDALSGFIGKWSIEKPEAWTRGTFAMTMAHYYKSAGYSLKEAAIQAKKDTSTLFVDYTPQERAMIFQRMGEAGKFASTVSTFKINNLNQWFTFSNKKMYGALATLALAQWFTSGLSGMPFVDDIEFPATALKAKGIIESTPKEWMLENMPDWAAFGPLSQASRLAGLPASALHRKFSASNTVPDDLASFIYPLASFYTNKVSKTADWISSGKFAGQEGKAWLREMVPGNLKYVVDSKLLSDKNGLVLDTNTMHDVNPTYTKRTQEDRVLTHLLGVLPQEEWKSKQIKQLSKISEQAWKTSTKSKVAKTISAFDNGDSEAFKKLYQEAVNYSPESAKEITKYIEGHAISRNMTLEQALQQKFAKGATTGHGVKMLQKFQRMQENRQ